MAYVITDTCTKDEHCIETCPVNCIHPTKDEADFRHRAAVVCESGGMHYAPVCPKGRSLFWRNCRPSRRALSRKARRTSTRLAVGSGQNSPRRALRSRLHVWLFAGGFGTGQAALQEFDLAIVIGFVFGHVEPFAVVVGRSPAPRFVHTCQPVIVALSKFCEGLLARFIQYV